MASVGDFEDESSSELRLLLDCVQQGLAVVGRDGVLNGLRSRMFDRWQPVIDRMRLVDWLRGLDPRVAAWIELGWDDLFAGVLPFETVAEQLPQRFSDGIRTFGLTLNPVHDRGGEIKRAVVVVSDLTDRVQRDAAEAEGRDLVDLLDLMTGDRRAFAEFVDSTDSLMQRIREWGITRETQMHCLHTLKGNALMVRLSTLAGVAHALEQKILTTGVLEQHDFGALEQAWSRIRSKVAVLTEERAAIEVSPDDLAQLIEAAARPNREGLGQLLASLKDEPAASRLSRFSERIGLLARECNKDVVVTVHTDGVRFDRATMRGFWAAFVHVLRNAVDHGIESPQQRRAAGKPAEGRIRLGAHRDGGLFVVEVEDDGGGIDWEAVRERAAALGVRAGTDVELSAALFVPALSTRKDVSLVSGRGIGLSAVAEAVASLNGRIEVSSRRGSGTTFRFTLPQPQR